MESLLTQEVVIIGGPKCVLIREYQRVSQSPARVLNDDQRTLRTL
jgi:hypothetical protein